MASPNGNIIINSVDDSWRRKSHVSTISSSRLHTTKEINNEISFISTFY